MRAMYTTHGARLRREAAGFTLMEVIFAVALTGLLFAAMYASLSTNISLIRLCRENQVATQTMTEQMELLRLYSWSAVTNKMVLTNFSISVDPKTPGSPVYYTGNVVIAAAPVTEAYGTNLRQAIVTIGWKSGNRWQKRNMTTFVAKNGLQSYIATHQ